MSITPTNISKNTITPVGATKSSVSTFTNVIRTLDYLNTENSLQIICENGDHLTLEGYSMGMVNISKS